jgi:predicted transcriptional regulator
VGTQPTERVALLSIRPEYAEAIFAGRKTVEFRRAPIADDVSVVVVYVTQPVGRVIGWFTVRQVRRSTPGALWRRFSSVAGIGRRAYFDYFDGSEHAYGIEIEKVTTLVSPLELDDVLPGLRPPQSFQYLSADCAQPVLDAPRRRRLAAAFAGI